jgi:hypothetical protein
MNNSTYAKIVVAYIFVITLFTAFQFNTVVSWITTGGTLKGLTVYFLTNVDYLLIFISVMYFTKGVSFIKRIVGSILTVMVIDIISYPRLSPAGLPTEAVMRTSSDAIMATAATGAGIPYATWWWLYYLVTPIVLSVLILWVLGFWQLGQIFKKR